MLISWQIPVIKKYCFQNIRGTFHNICSGAQLVGGGGGLPCPFLKIEKKCPDLAKKCPDFGKICPVCVRLWVKIPI